MPEKITQNRSRRNIKPIARGNNSFGRKGTRKCGVCRQWRIKCEYDRLDSPCTICKERGKQCGLKEKTYGRVGERTRGYARGEAEPLAVEDAGVAEGLRSPRGQNFSGGESDQSDNDISDQRVVRYSPSRRESRLPWAQTSLEGAADLRLLYHYMSEVAHTFTLPGPIAQTWQKCIPQLAFGGNHVHLLHALLAVSAAHRVHLHPTDDVEQWNGLIHYQTCINLLQKLDFNARETNPAATLATTVLLTWYEVLTGNKEKRREHMLSGANIVRQRGADLLSTKTGCQLFHLFARLELASYRHFSLRGVIPADINRWKTLTFYNQMVTAKDMRNGNTAFELAWVNLLNIMGRFMELRLDMSIAENHALGSPEYLARGEQIEQMLVNWEEHLPGSFLPIEEGPKALQIMEASTSIVQEMKPIYYRSLNIAVAMAHHSALRIDAITHTHRADADRPDYNLTAALKTLRICLGVQLMRSAGLCKVHEGVDYGIVWPLLKAAEWAPTPSIRKWILELLSNWPLEGVMDPQHAKLCLDVHWSRLDKGYIIEYCRVKCENVWGATRTGKPIEIELAERASTGEYREGYRIVGFGLILVRITIQNGKWNVLEMDWR